MVTAASSGGPRVVTRLPCSDRAPGLARRAVAAYLVTSTDRDLLDDAALLTTEAVTNAVRYAGPPLTLIVELRSGTLEIQVHDSSSTVPRQVDAAPGDTRGRGMAIMDAIAVEWGVDQIPGDGKNVWFRLAAA